MPAHAVPPQTPSADAQARHSRRILLYSLRKGLILFVFIIACVFIFSRMHGTSPDLFMIVELAVLAFGIPVAFFWILDKLTPKPHSEPKVRLREKVRLPED